MTTPAFPFNQSGEFDEQYSGMELRDYFAAKAMQALLTGAVDWNEENVARYAYNMADAMLEERE